MSFVVKRMHICIQFKIAFHPTFTFYCLFQIITIAILLLPCISDFSLYGAEFSLYGELKTIFRNQIIFASFINSTNAMSKNWSGNFLTIVRSFMVISISYSFQNSFLFKEFSSSFCACLE